MKKYLKYLLDDMRAARRRLPSPPEFPPDLPEFLRGVEEFQFSPQKPMYEWFGLDLRMFPPAARWTEKDLHTVVKALRQLWRAYNYIPDFPPGIDVELKYNLMLKVMTEPIPYVSQDTVTVDFCDMNIQTCLLGELCSCREIVEMMDTMPHRDEIVIADPDREVRVSDGMERYFVQMMQDLEKVLHRLTGDEPNEHPEDDDIFDYEEDEADFFSYLQQYAEEGMSRQASEPEDEESRSTEESWKPLGERLGIPGETFPEIAQLSTDMVIQTVRMIEKIWWYAGYVPCFPEALPVETRYVLFRENWNRPVPQSADDSVYIEFCAGDPEECIFGSEMCLCAQPVTDSDLYEDSEAADEQWNEIVAFSRERYSLNDFYEEFGDEDEEDWDEEDEDLAF